MEFPWYERYVLYYVDCLPFWHLTKLRDRKDAMERQHKALEQVDAFIQEHEIALEKAMGALDERVAGVEACKREIGVYVKHAEKMGERPEMQTEYLKTATRRLSHHLGAVERAQAEVNEVRTVLDHMYTVQSKIRGGPAAVANFKRALRQIGLTLTDRALDSLEDGALAHDEDAVETMDRLVTADLAGDVQSLLERVSSSAGGGGGGGNSTLDRAQDIVDSILALERTPQVLPEAPRGGTPKVPALAPPTR